MSGDDVRDKQPYGRYFVVDSFASLDADTQVAVIEDLRAASRGDVAELFVECAREAPEDVELSRVHDFIRSKAESKSRSVAVRLDPSKGDEAAAFWEYAPSSQQAVAVDQHGREVIEFKGVPTCIAVARRVAERVRRDGALDWDSLFNPEPRALSQSRTWKWFGGVALIILLGIPSSFPFRSLSARPPLAEAMGGVRNDFCVRRGNIRPCQRCTSGSSHCAALGVEADPPAILERASASQGCDRVTPNWRGTLRR